MKFTRKNKNRIDLIKVLTHEDRKNYDLWFGSGIKQEIAQNHRTLNEICYKRCSMYRQFELRRILWVIDYVFY